MNPLQTHPNLFANGEFKFMYGDCACSLIELDICDGSPFLLFDGVESFWANSENCTLIARPIEDMSDEEISKAMPGSLKEPDYRRTYLRNRCREGILNREIFLYLLSIGVYPFDQSHFEDGKVISKAELKTEQI